MPDTTHVDASGIEFVEVTAVGTADAFTAQNTNATAPMRIAYRATQPDAYTRDAYKLAGYQYGGTMGRVSSGRVWAQGGILAVTLES